SQGLRDTMTGKTLSMRFLRQGVLLGLMVGSLAGLSAAPPAQAAPNSMAAGLSWKGSVDTNLKFSEFYTGNHTLALRFMPQFPNAYEGPLIAENGSGRFMIGQADYLNGGDGTKLLLAIGSQTRAYPAALKPGRWYH